MSHEHLRAVRAARVRLASEGPGRGRSAGDFARVSIPSSDGDRLRDLLLAERAVVVIEIGLAYGSSALAIAEALVAGGSEHARHTIIDPYQDTFDRVGDEAISRAGLAGMCVLIEERSQLALPRMAAEGLVFDAAFVDGSHIFHNVFTDLVYLRELVRPGGLVILDDCDHLSVATAVSYFETNLGWERQPTTAETRLRAYRLPDPRTEPGFESFLPFGADPAS